MLKRSLRLLGAALGLTIAATLTVTPAQAVDTGYYSVPYDSTLYRLDTTTEEPYPASYEEWSSDGSPTPIPASTEFYKVSWSRSVYAVSFLGRTPWQWVWRPLSFEQWTRVGQPVPRVTGAIPGTRYFQWASSPEIAASLPGAEWHTLTYAEWTAIGRPAPVQEPTAGFYKYPWSTGVGYLWDTTLGVGDTLSYNDYLWWGSPTPQTVTHVIGEVVWKKRGSSTLYLDSPITGGGFALTYDQWSALGRPAPTVY